LRKNKGLYDPRLEHDSCGVGFIADLNAKKSHWIVKKGIEILENLEHRGAVGAEKDSGDGAGILVQMPDEFLRKECSKIGITLPEIGHYGSGIVFLPQKKDNREKIKEIFEKCTQEIGQEVIGWREVPVDNSTLGKMVRDVEPFMEQVFVKRGKAVPDDISFERKLYVLRKHARKTIIASGIGGATEDYFVSSLSYKTMSYKGMLTSPQVMEYFTDLSDKEMKSALAMVHSRFSTNTFPSWPLGQPFRYLAHNGEINTLRGNVNRMSARESSFMSDVFTPEDFKKLLPIIDDTQSDSAIIDNAVELLALSGRSLPHVMAMLIPEAWAHDKEMDPKKRAFYEFHATMMEPWDGPASIAFTDGHLIGATLDRNGLRPSRYQLTDDNILVMASEAGVLEFPPEKIVLKGRLQPGRMFIASLDEGRIIPDEEIKQKLASERPYEQWLAKGKLELRQIDKVRSPHQPDHETLIHRQAAFGNTLEDLKMILLPMANTGAEPIGSMGNDIPLAVLSDKPQNLFNYFYQLFAQVTNPPIDPIREESVMSLVSFIGFQGQLLSESKEHCRVIELPHPVITNHQIERLRKITVNDFSSANIPIVFHAVAGEKNLEKALDEICRQSVEAVDSGNNILILSDRTVDTDHAPIPSLLAVSAIHYHLIREGKRTKCSIIVESGEAREVHHFALLLGYGASAVNPYLAFETIEDMRLSNQLDEGITRKVARDNYIKAVGKGLLKILSKMGISTIQSYIGAQIFEVVGLSDELVEKYFNGTTSRLGGIDLDTLEEESLLRHQYAFPSKDEIGTIRLEHGGHYHWRARGEIHSFNPQTIQILQRSTRTNDYELYKQYANLINEQKEDLNTIRGLLDFTENDSIPIEEVEPVESIVKRFFTGAMSFGSISKEAHETLAIAMNRLGAKSNTGEGGEDPERFKPRPNGDSARSSIKQVASGRFGVTSNYLVNSDELQIKMAQGAKPGEGGQLPGSKVDKVIARIRHSTPGVGLISPPPHHDIYSIEDLAQLIFDLKNANVNARINVKLVSEVGVGTIAAGVAKGHSEAVLISGQDGGTGASPQSSIKHAGLPWELGLAETHQVLMRNNLRSRIVVQTDGRILTGRDVAVATLLGAEEWGTATAALIVSGCVMMRKCHLNSCPVGIATQDEKLRKFYSGDPQYLVNFITFLATELREYMAKLGFRTVNEMVGRADTLKVREDIKHWKGKHLNVERLIYKAESPGCDNYCSEPQDFGLEKALDHKLIEIAKPALDNKEKVEGSFKIRNIHRTVGTMLSAEISRRYGEDGLPEDSIRLKVEGSAGQSFAAFGAKGLTFELEGEANDYFCKGLSGAKVILYPPKVSKFNPHYNVIVGNVAFYGATEGESYIRGLAGERFCVRNSGAKVVVDSVGDHGCEYMTGGRVVILGPIGKNFAAGMSGGIAYILDMDGKAKGRINTQMVDLEKLVDPEEIEEVKGMIARHRDYTEAKTAIKILEDWKTFQPKFIKVMPKDYKRALAELAQEAEVTEESMVS
jgi:glutamate synthase domain-containing protein 2/glutamate synthase domain-containing protein 1/glutamate synthase domain-containing protein 3